MSEQVEQIGRYVVLAELGRGGFGKVYRVRDSNLNREVALKVLYAQMLVDPTLVERFRREAQVVANLDHPHIVPIYDYGDIEDRLGLVMKLLPGGSLAKRIDEGPLPWEEVVRLTGQVATALDYAHERGLVHRDIKPANVLLDDEGNAVLGDFGLVRALEGSQLTVSLSGGVLGTPAYIAPEVWDGMEATPLTDIYALACVVYEMIVGEQLFDATNMSGVIARHLREREFPETWPEGTPAGIERVLGRALAIDPAARYPSAGAFVAALAELGADPLAEPYAALRAALAAEAWDKAVALAEGIVQEDAGYRDARALMAQARAGRVAAERAAWVAEWQEEAERALAAGEWEKALAVAQRWQGVTPEDKAAEAAIRRAEAGLQQARSRAEMAPPAGDRPHTAPPPAQEELSAGWAEPVPASHVASRGAPGVKTRAAGEEKAAPKKKRRIGRRLLIGGGIAGLLLACACGALLLWSELLQPQAVVLPAVTSVPTNRPASTVPAHVEVTPAAQPAGQQVAEYQAWVRRSRDDYASALEQVAALEERAGINPAVVVGDQVWRNQMFSALRRIEITSEEILDYRAGHVVPAEFRSFHSGWEEAADLLWDSALSYGIWLEDFNDADLAAAQDAFALAFLKMSELPLDQFWP
jgi:predicted Ser/Thr protein kinase